jgi:catechol 2,3-dioxygenase-like lactoylglutathione lyase family enzyme
MVRTYGLTHISLTVRDVERSYQFYRSVFGVEEYYRESGQIQAKTPGAHDVIVFNEGTKHAGKSGGIAHIGFRLVNAADIHAAAKAVEQAGGNILSRGEWEGGEPYLFFNDLDGYEVEVWFE